MKFFLDESFFRRNFPQQIALSANSAHL